MNHRIMADWTTLMRQAPSTASVYFNESIRTLDTCYGDEKRTAQRVDQAIALAAIAAQDYNTAAISVAAQTIADALKSISEKE